MLRGWAWWWAGWGRVRVGGGVEIGRGDNRVLSVCKTSLEN